MEYTSLEQLREQQIAEKIMEELEIHGIVGRGDGLRDILINLDDSGEKSNKQDELKDADEGDPCIAAVIRSGKALSDILRSTPLYGGVKWPDLED